ncbi:MAG: LysR family transcriptional regulator [Actinomycetota bacterium]
MTLNQLQVFVLVARLGSASAAARALGVTEPAVSKALSALRKHFGDPLLERQGNGMELTAGGRRLLAIAAQMVALGDEAEQAVRATTGAPERVRITAAPTFADRVAPTLLDAFTSKGDVEATLGLGTKEEMAALLHERMADVVIGPKLDGELGRGLDAAPLLRYRLILVAEADLAASIGPGPADRLRQQHWLLGPDAADEAAPVRRLVEHLKVPEERLRVFASIREAWSAAESGHGIAPAVEHLVRAELDRTALVPLPVQGFPVELMWWISSQPTDRRSHVVSDFRRFVASPPALQAMHHPVGGVHPSRFRPPVHITIWS